MKYISLLVTILAICLCSCTYIHTQTDKSYTMYWQENNLCIVMPHPTMDNVEPGKPYWRGVRLDNVVKDIYTECLQCNKSGDIDITIWVRFENPQTDKYGNETMAYNEYKIATIPLSEARKYKSGKYLDNEYKLKKGFHNAAFGSPKTSIDTLRQAILEDGTRVYIALGDSLATEKN